MNTKKGFVNILVRILGVVLTAGLCLVFGTALPAPEPPAEAQEHTPLVTPEPTPSPEPEYFNLSFVGDCTLACSTYNKSLAGSYENTVGDNYAYPFELTRDFFKDDDMTFANLECALTTEENQNPKAFTFKADPGYVNILTEGSVEFVTLGNNHVLDYGEQGYADTKAALDKANIAYAGRDEYAVFETKNGLKIGVYADSFGEEAKIKAGIAALKAQNVDFIIAALHWGDEGSYDVNDLQRAQAHAAIDAGADFVYGSHPHTLQPREEYNGGVIYYSMGNWSFGGNTAPRDPDTIILQMKVKRDIDGTISIDSETITPCACTGVTGGNNYQPVPYEKDSEAYKRTLSKIDGSFEGANLTIGYTYTINEVY